MSYNLRKLKRNKKQIFLNFFLYHQPFCQLMEKKNTFQHFISNIIFGDCFLKYKEGFLQIFKKRLRALWLFENKMRALPKLSILGNWAPKNIPDRQPCVVFEIRKIVLNHSNLCCPLSCAQGWASILLKRTERSLRFFPFFLSIYIYIFLYI